MEITFFIKKILEKFKLTLCCDIILLRKRNIDILIDSSTPCLIDRNTGEIVDTFYEKLALIDLRKIKKKDGWKFSWITPYYKGYDVFTLKLKGDDTLQGLIALKVNEQQKAVHIDIVENAPHNFSSKGLYEGVGAHLFAIAIKISKELGCGGFVYFEAKTSLIEYYKKMLGAKQVGNSQLMFIEEPEALKLLEIYYSGGEDNAQD